MRYWFVSENRLEHAAADRLPVKWPVRIIRLPSCGLLVLGFNEVEIVHLYRDIIVLAVTVKLDDFM